MTEETIPFIVAEDDEFGVEDSEKLALMQFQAEFLKMSAQIEAIKVRVVAMQTLNAQRESDGLAQAYDEAAFLAEADKIEGIVDQLEQFSQLVDKEY